MSSVQVNVATISTMVDPEDFDIDREFLDANDLDNPTIDKIMYQMRNYLLRTQISNGLVDGASKEARPLKSNASQVNLFFSNTSGMKEESTNGLNFLLAGDTSKLSVYSKLGNVAKRIGCRIGRMFKFSERSSCKTEDGVTGDHEGYSKTCQFDDTLQLDAAPYIADITDGRIVDPKLVAQTKDKRTRKKVGRNNDRNQGDTPDITSSCAHEQHCHAGLSGCSYFPHDDMKNVQPKSRDDILPHSRLLYEKKKNKKIHSKAKDDKSLQNNRSNLFLSNHSIHKNQEQQQGKFKMSYTCPVPIKPPAHSFNERTRIKTASKINKTAGNCYNVESKKKQFRPNPLNNTSFFKEEAESSSEEKIILVQYLSQSNINMIPMHKPKCTDISLKSYNTLKTGDRGCCPVKPISDAGIMLTPKSASLDLTRQSSVSVIFLASKYSPITSSNSDFILESIGNENKASDKHNRRPFKSNVTRYKIDKFTEGNENLVLLYIAKELQKPRNGFMIKDYKTSKPNCKMLSNIFTEIHHTSKPNNGIICNSNEFAYMYQTTNKLYDYMFGNSAYCNIHSLPNNEGLPMYRRKLHTVRKTKNARQEQSHPISHLIGNHCVNEEATQKDDYNQAITGPEIYFNFSFDKTTMVHVNIGTSPQSMIRANRETQKHNSLEGDNKRTTGRNGRTLSFSESNVADSRYFVRNTEDNSFYFMNDNSCHSFLEGQTNYFYNSEKSDSIPLSILNQPESRNEVRVNWMPERSTPLCNGGVHEDYLKQLDRRTRQCEEMTSSEEKAKSKRNPNIPQFTLDRHIWLPKNGDAEYILGDKTFTVKSIKSEIPINIQIYGVNKNNHESLDIHRFGDRLKCVESFVELIFSEDFISNLSSSSISLLSAASLHTSYIINQNERGRHVHSSNDKVKPFEVTRLIENAMHEMLLNFSLNLAFKGAYSHAFKPIQVNEAIPTCCNSEVTLEEMPPLSDSSATLNDMSASSSLSQNGHSIIENNNSESSYILEEDEDENSETSLLNNRVKHNLITDNKSESSYILEENEEDYSDTSLLSNRVEHNLTKDSTSESSYILEEDGDRKRCQVSLVTSNDDIDIDDEDESNAEFQTEMNNNQELAVDYITNPYLTSHGSQHEHKHNNPVDVSNRSTKSILMHECDLSQTNQTERTVSSGLSVNQMSTQNEELNSQFSSEIVYENKSIEKTESDVHVVPEPITLFLRGTYSVHSWDSAGSASLENAPAIQTTSSTTSVDGTLFPSTFHTPICVRLSKVHRYMRADSSLQRKHATKSVSQKSSKCIQRRQFH